MMEHQENVARATGYLVRKGLLEKCENHGEVFGGGNGDLDSEFYRNAMADRKRGDGGPIPWSSDLEAREFTDILVEAYEEHCGDDCGYCAKNAAE